LALIRARQAYVRGTLGVNIRDEVLPLSCTCANFRPFWLAPDRALAFTEGIRQYRGSREETVDRRERRDRWVHI